MKYEERKLPTWFKPPTRFDVKANYRASQEAAFEALKAALLKAKFSEGGELDENALLRRAANDAAALAWATPYPVLVFPLLFEEKSVQVRRQAHKQAQVRERSRALMTEAV